MKFRALAAVFFLLVMLLSGCQSQGGPQETPVPEATPLPTLEADKGGITGTAISKKTGGVLANTVVRLAEVVRQEDQAAFVLDTAFSPGTITDANGKFAFMNVPAVEYVIVIGNVEVYQGYEILQDSTGQANVYIVTAGEILEVGDLEVNLEPAGN
jgi:hypothetical protein